MIEALFAVAEAVDKTPAQVAINWLLQMPGVTAPIIGVRTMEHLKTNLGAIGWALSEAQMAQLNRASQVAPPYPYDFIENYLSGIAGSALIVFLSIFK